MKKFIKFMSVVAVASLVITGCSNKGNSSSSKNQDSTYKIVAVTGEGGSKDKSFNQANVEAMQKWTKDNGAKDPVIIETNNQANIVPNLQNASKTGNIVSLAGYEFENEILSVSSQFPDVKYIFIDSETKGNNIASLVFKEQEAGYLAGYVAALQSKTGKIGFIGGTKMPPVERFGLGFIQGAKAANKDIEILYNYSGTFADTNKGKTLAATMYDSGVDVIFAAAGSTGNGAISEAKEKAAIDYSNSGEIKHWIVGVDKDQYEEGLVKLKDKDGKTIEKSVILTSAVKRIDVAVTKVLDEIKQGKFTAGISIFGIKENGVGLPEKNPNLSNEVTSKVDKLIEDLKSEKITIVDTLEKLTDKSKIQGDL